MDVHIANAIMPHGPGLAGHALPVDGGLTIQLQEDLAVGRGKFLQGRPDVLAKL
jgi:hypothetical protein